MRLESIRYRTEDRLGATLSVGKEGVVGLRLQDGVVWADHEDGTYGVPLSLCINLKALDEGPLPTGPDHLPPPPPVRIPAPSERSLWPWRRRTP